MQLIANHYLAVVDCWSYGELLSIHSSLSNFNHSNVSTNLASRAASCCLLSTKFQSFKHTSASIVSGLKPHLYSTTYARAHTHTQKASDATMEIGTDNISQSIMESMRYFDLFSTNPINQTILLHWFQVKVDLNNVVIQIRHIMLLKMPILLLTIW